MAVGGASPVSSAAALDEVRMRVLARVRGRPDAARVHDDRAVAERQQPLEVGVAAQHDGDGRSARAKRGVERVGEQRADGGGGAVAQARRGHLLQQVALVVAGRAVAEQQPGGRGAGRRRGGQRGEAAELRVRQLLQRERVADAAGGATRVAGGERGERVGEGARGAGGGR